MRIGCVFLQAFNEIAEAVGRKSYFHLMLNTNWLCALLPVQLQSSFDTLFWCFLLDDPIWVCEGSMAMVVLWFWFLILVSESQSHFLIVFVGSL